MGCFFPLLVPHCVCHGNTRQCNQLFLPWCEALPFHCCLRERLLICKLPTLKANKLSIKSISWDGSLSVPSHYIFADLYIYMEHNSLPIRRHGNPCYFKKKPLLHLIHNINKYELPIGSETCRLKAHLNTTLHNLDQSQHNTQCFITTFCVKDFKKM